jgi:hypothetical protein
MHHRRAWQGLGIGIIGLALALAPMSLASAHSTKKPKHHTTTASKGSGGSSPGSSICVDIKSEENSSSSTGTNIAKAIEGGNFASAKQALLASFNTENSDVQKALSALSSAPSNVQTAFKGILAYVGQLKSAIENATSLQGLTTAFEGLGHSTQLESDSTTIDNWARGLCGSSVVPTTAQVTTPSVPSGLGGTP